MSPRGPDTGLDAVVADRLGRPPQGAWEVAAWSDSGEPVVIRNAPLLDDGRPMPTRYWLIDPDLRAAIGRLEAGGGVRRAEAEVDAGQLAAAHRAYRDERDAALPIGYEGPRPSGGVGGTRVGVKCLHAHYAWFLVGGDDPVGRWVDGHLAATDSAPAPTDSAPAPTDSARPTATPPDLPASGARRRIDDDSVPRGGNESGGGAP